MESASLGSQVISWDMRVRDTEGGRAVPTHLSPTQTRRKSRRGAATREELLGETLTLRVQVGLEAMGSQTSAGEDLRLFPNQG